MKKLIQDENFAEIMQKLIKLHNKPKYSKLRFMQLLQNCFGTNDPYYVTDEQLLELLEETYE